MAVKKRNILGAIALTATLALTACNGAGGRGGEADAANYPSSQVTINSPFNPGGGIDLAINSIIQVLGETKLTTAQMRLNNMPGGSGMVATGTLASDCTGATDQLLVTSVSNLSASLQDSQNVGLSQMVPLAGLFAEYTYAYVRKDSPFTKLSDVVDAIKAQPGKVKIGGASLGSADNIVVADLAKLVGVPFSQLAYLPLEGAENQTNLLGGQIDVAFGGPDLLSLVESGDARVLAVSAPKRLTADRVKNVPTMTELGYNVTQSNWRGAFGPPDMPDYAVKYWNDTFKKLATTPQWKAVADKNTWEITGLDQQQFKDFLTTEQGNLTTSLTELGLIQN
ncbi:MAG: Bug family tripartite tricarboxylate transporter substrate binding protein [Myxococcota bacterium]